MRRQAVRFRLYAELHDGTVQELSLDDGVQIEWTVEVANLKAGWYAFENAMDLPGQYAIAEKRRNPLVTGAQRQALTSAPAPGPSAAAASKASPFISTPAPSTANPCTWANCAPTRPGA